jgi:hypothetical protein
VVARVVTCSVLCGLGLAAPGWGGDKVVRAAGQGPNLAAPVWTELELEARKLFLKATTRVSVRLEPATVVEGDLRVPPEGVPRQPTGPRVAVVSLSSDLPFGRRQASTAWVDAASGAALQGERLSTGRKPSWKQWRYLDGGRYVWRVSPHDPNEESLDRSAWTRRRDRLERWREVVPSGLVVSDSYALLYLVSAGRLDRGGSELRFCLEADDRLVEVRLVAGELITDRFELEEVAGGSTRVRSGEIRAQAVRGLGRPVGGGGGAEDVDLGFLGLKGEVTILLEEGTGMPLEVRGRAEGVGRVTVRVRRVVLVPEAAGGEG